MSEVRLGQGLYSRLSQLSIGARVYPKRLPQPATLPAICYHLISGPSPITAHDDMHDGSGLGPRSEIARVQLDCWASTHQDAESLYAEVVSALHASRGMWGDLEVQMCLKDISFDDEDQDTNTWRYMVDFKIMYRGGVEQGS